MKKNRRSTKGILNVGWICILLVIAMLFTGCGQQVQQEQESQEQDITEAENEYSSEEESNEDDSEEEYCEEEPQIDIENSELYEIPEEDLGEDGRTYGEIPFEADQAKTYAKRVHCLFDMPTQQLVFQCKFLQVPSSDDEYLYLFAFDTFDDIDDFDGQPYAVTDKGHSMQIALEYNRVYLFTRFVPALLVDGSFVAVSDPVYIGNPESLAPNQSDYPEIGTKKGLLLDPATIGTDALNELNVKQAIYNMPLSQIIGESTNPEIPTIEFVYNDQTYYFNGATISAYDSLFSYLSEQGIYTTVIILNDWNEAYPEVMHPLSRKQTRDSLYYAFNTEEETGVRLIEATALFLAERYSSGWYGMVYNWVIANEINQHTSWNYMNTTDLQYYTESFERSFRIFYNAIRSQYANAGVYFSLDHDWNDNGGNNGKWFNGRELLETFNKVARKGGNYDWGVAIHPYPNPLTRVNYWSEKYDMTEDADILTIMNLSAITKILEKREFRDTSGDVRSVTITELGFTSNSGEKLQAAAFAYCYYIIDENPYIDTFMMNRQTDAREEMRTGLSFGIYHTDLSEKYIARVFRDIDTEKAEEYTSFILNILHADSMEEALSWAKPAEEEE